MKSYLQCFPYLRDKFPENESYKTLLGPRCKLKGFIQTFSFSSADEGKVTELAFPISSHSQRKNPTPQAGSFPRLLVASSCVVGAPGPPALGTTTGSRSRTAGMGSVAALGPAAASSSTVPNALLLTYTTELTGVSISTHAALLTPGTNTQAPQPAQAQSTSSSHAGNHSAVNKRLFVRQRLLSKRNPRLPEYCSLQDKLLYIGIYISFSWQKQKY